MSGTHSTRALRAAITSGLVATAFFAAGCRERAASPPPASSASRAQAAAPPARPTIAAARFDATGWAAGERTAERGSWVSNEGDTLQLQLASPDALPPADEGALRDRTREAAVRRGAGLISADGVNIGSDRAARTILKVPQRPHGMTYEGTLVLAHADAVYRFTLHCQERGATGMRDTFVMDRWLGQRMARMSPTAGPDSLLEGWARDPYDPSRRDPVMRNQSEDERYDGDFPDHPLSRLRRHLARLQASLRFEP